ncbi:Myb/SANT-like DNA-binding domain protein [Sesbania bispinosa]|nr:Myb/SANT-like DNA-binding domain protein [Sesbania bispinosa]
MSNNPAKVKHKMRQSGGAAKLRCQIDTLVSNSSKALEIMHSEGSVSKDNGASSTVAAAMTVINRMVNDFVLEDGSELWGFALSFIENEVRRQIFLNLETDAARKSWLMYMHAKEK